MMVVMVMISQRGRRRRVNRPPDAGSRGRGGRLLLVMMVMMVMLLLVLLLLLQQLLHLRNVHKLLQLTLDLRPSLAHSPLGGGHHRERIAAVVLQVFEPRERIRGLVIAAPGHVFAAHRECQHLFKLSRRRPSSRCRTTCRRPSPCAASRTTCDAPSTRAPTATMPTNTTGASKGTCHGVAAAPPADACLFSRGSRIAVALGARTSKHRAAGV